MKKYQFVEDRDKKCTTIDYGELGECQLLCNIETRELCVLRYAPKMQLIKDIQCLTQMNHPNIIKVYDYFDHDDHTAIVFELLAGGDLFKKIYCKEIKYYHIAPIFKGICKGIQYIHSRKIIHRNLKSQTILLDNNMNPKIVDFGLAARLSTRRTFCGCYFYMSPEILKGIEYKDKADIWALGIILYQMVYGQVPFKGQSTKQVLQSIENSKLYDKFIEKGSFDQLIRLMLQYDSKKRISISQVLQFDILKVQPLNMMNLPKSLKISKSIQLKHDPTKKIIINRSVELLKKKKKEGSKIYGFKECVANKIGALFDKQKIRSSQRYNYILTENDSVK